MRRNPPRGDAPSADIESMRDDLAAVLSARARLIARRAMAPGLSTASSNAPTELLSTISGTACSVDGPSEVTTDIEETERVVLRELALRRILQLNYFQDALREPSREVMRFDEPLLRLGDTLTALMDAAGGIGLAAPQIGVSKRMFVFVNENHEPEIVVNPRVTKRSRDIEIDTEGCLSIPRVLIEVERSTEILVEGKSVRGERIKRELGGMTARCALHEIDHLDGRLIIDYLDEPERASVLARVHALEAPLVR
jgi:peptide deformylase